ncbi:lipocalin family protein [Pedobacter gandavensis]|uniref:lipocalin family protein n=1 Tax=Pedobacter gandavensis TaxID=2679963 RepID=UPI00292EEA6F|nr:lipocalin family protein [Pedobacter gandavensis]
MNLKVGLFILSSAMLPVLNLMKDANPVEKDLPIQGTWQLVSGETIAKGKSTFTDYKKGMKQIKMFNGTHFAFFNHDLKHGKDPKPVFVAGGGTYTLKGNKYTEHLEYFISRDWEDKTFEFTLSMKGDTLIQRGFEKDEKLGVDHEIIEKYVRLKN